MTDTPRQHLSRSAIGRLSRSVERALRDQRKAEPTTILNAHIEALRVWMTEQARNAEQLADDDKLGPPLNELLSLLVDGTDEERALLQAKAQGELRARLGPRHKALGYTGATSWFPPPEALAATGAVELG